VAVGDRLDPVNRSDQSVVLAYLRKRVLLVREVIWAFLAYQAFHDCPHVSQNNRQTPLSNRPDAEVDKFGTVKARKAHLPGAGIDGEYAIVFFRHIFARGKRTMRDGNA